MEFAEAMETGKTGLLFSFTVIFLDKRMIISTTLHFRHYQTFDGEVFNMRVDPDCSYVLAKSNGFQSIPFEISIENNKCT